MRRLVVAHALPNHSLTVLVVVPEGVVAVVGLYVGSVHAYILIIACAHNDFLSPVAQDVARGRGRVLSPVAVGSTIGGEHNAAVSHVHDRVLRIRDGRLFIQHFADTLCAGHAHGDCSDEQ